jgi:hypothetical protein
MMGEDKSTREANPLAEVFGYPSNNFLDDAKRHRQLRLCPYHNRSANCTKDKADDPLGVCSIYDTDGSIAITCPVRFRQDWRIAEDAASFFFPEGTRWSALSEIRLTDADGQSAGNIDMVLVAYDSAGYVVDFGAIEVQGVYISGNVRRVFQSYMDDPVSYLQNPPKIINRPRADYLSSSRKRLAPQLLYKGGILHAWRKKTAIVLHKHFFETLPKLQEVSKDVAEMAWMVYDLVLDNASNTYKLTPVKTVYTAFEDALAVISRPTVGKLEDFMGYLQQRVVMNAREDDSTPPDTLSLNDLV